MSEPRYSSAACHLLLACSSAAAFRVLHRSGGGYKWACGTLGLYFVKSCLGIVRFGFENGNDLAELYDHVLYVSSAVGLPCMATELYLFHSIRWEYAILHFGFSLLPVTAHFTDTHEEDLLSLVVIGCVISLCGLGVVKENYYAIGAGLWYALNEFCIRKEGKVGDLEPKDLFILGLSVFTFFMIQSFDDTIKLSLNITLH